MHDPDRQGVHATALEGHVDVLQEMKQTIKRIQANNYKNKNQHNNKKLPDLWPGLDILPEQPLLVERVAGLSCNGIDGALVDLLLDCTQQQEERLAHGFLEKVAEKWSQNSAVCLNQPQMISCAHLEVAVHADGHPVSQHLLHNRLCPTQHQFGVLGSRGVDQVHQQVFHNAGVVLQFTVEGNSQQRCQAASEG